MDDHDEEMDVMTEDFWDVMKISPIRGLRGGRLSFNHFHAPEATPFILQIIFLKLTGRLEIMARAFPREDLINDTSGEVDLGRTGHILEALCQEIPGMRKLSGGVSHIRIAHAVCEADLATGQPRALRGDGSAPVQPFPSPSPKTVWKGLSTN